MAAPVTVTISPAVARYVRRGVTSDEKRQGIAEASSLSPHDQVTLFFCLSNDPDEDVRQQARSRFVRLSDEMIHNYLVSENCHPAVRELLLRVHGSRPALAPFMQKGDADDNGPATEGGAESSLMTVPNRHKEFSDDEDLSDDSLLLTTDEEGEVDEEGEEFLSKYRLAQTMGIAEKIKMALTGDKEWRSLLIKDANKLVSGSVVKNPRITEGEILTILKVGVQNDEIVRVICANKEWIKNYKIRKALVDCPKTPLPNALRFLASLDIKDIAHYAKSKNISSVLSTQAKRMLLAKKR